MMTVEVFANRPVPRELADRLLHDLIAEESAPESVLAGARALTHVVVHEPLVWATGGKEGPRYLVRVTVPGSWNTNQFGEYMVPRITAIVAGFEDDPDRLLREPHCVVQLVGLREHGIGTLGRVTTSTEITRLMTEDYRSSAAHRDNTVDPVCGMAVDPSTSALTLTHNGTTYAFCAPVCRKVYAEEHGIAG